MPYGIYDLSRNQGTMYVGMSADIPRFAVDVIARWWESRGRLRYPLADHLLILADGGGSNGYRCRVWKQQPQAQLADRWRLTVTVCHYPTGCSKWNPLEHRLFGPISLNWAGKPLLTWDTLLAYLRGTQTSTGLEVEAFLHEGVYATGGTVSEAEMETLNLERHTVCPDWNYTIRPRSDGHSTADGPQRRLCGVFLAFSAVGRSSAGALGGTGTGAKNNTMSTKPTLIRWAPRVRRDRIRRLYESDARGMLDEELLDDVGYGMYARCKDIIEVSNAAKGRVGCRQCGSIIVRHKGPVKK